MAPQLGASIHHAEPVNTFYIQILPGKESKRQHRQNLLATSRLNQECWNAVDLIGETAKNILGPRDGYVESESTKDTGGPM